MSALSGTCSILKVPCYTDSPLYPRHFRKASSNSNHASRAPNLRTIVSARHPKRPRNSSDQLPVAQRTITKLVELPVIPIGSYISSHPSIIHRLDPRLKQAWLAALLLFPPNGTSEAKLLVCLFLTLMRSACPSEGSLHGYAEQGIDSSLACSTGQWVKNTWRGVGCE